MARTMDELLARVANLDPNLASSIKAQMTSQTYGLVWEKHSVEDVALYSMTDLTPGWSVQILPPRGVNAAALKSSRKKADREQVDPLWGTTWTIEEVNPNSAFISCDGTQLDAVLLTALRGGTGYEKYAEHNVSVFESPLDDGDVEVSVRMTYPLDDLVAIASFDKEIFPGLIKTGEVRRGGVDDPDHVVINAENFHALKMLTYTHAGKIDAIYIDPPYNTGAKDWKYNNNYVSGEDSFRHSKWLSFMESRLHVARELLNPDDSVLIVTIDEKEYLNLGILLRQMFPGARIQMVSSVINPKGVVRLSEFSRVNEYIYVCMFGSQKIAPERVVSVPSDVSEPKREYMTWQPLRRSDIDSARHGVTYRKTQFYPIYVNTASGFIEEVGEPILRDVDRFSVPSRPNCDTVFPVREDGTEIVWGLGKESFCKLLNQGYAKTGSHMPNKPQQWMIQYLTSGKIKDIEDGKAEILGTNSDGSVIVAYVDTVGKTKMPSNQWERPSHNAQHYGTEVIKAFLGSSRFTYPKSLYAVEDALRFFVKDKPEATILDFFSGSGTTAHAVMRLNKQDGGKRRSISVTNNEVSADEVDKLTAKNLRPGDAEWDALGICDYVTKPRIAAAITGHVAGDESKPKVKGEYKFTDEFGFADGFEANASFYTMNYLNPFSVKLGNNFEDIAPLLWLKAGQTGAMIEHEPDGAFAITDRYAVIFGLDGFAEAAAALEENESVTHLFVVTDNANVAVRANELWPHLDVTQLYTSYLENFKIDL